MTHTWVTDACTLPTAEQPLREAEFDALFAAHLVELRRVSPARLTLVLTGGATAEATTRDLVARETACCSFFGFQVSRDDDRITLDVTVPEAYVTVLDALAARAQPQP